MELAIRNLQRDVKNLASRDTTKQIEKAREIAKNAVKEIKNVQVDQSLTNSDLIEAITEIALLLGEEAAKHD
ncbi:MAG: hypothetical protein J6Q61_00990 [Bacteroidales bacterium]|nr:hypothetical protein [Bacteroidales bacterium]